MSYILDALKKAQAERQLGNAPTIHAPPPSYAAPASTARRTPLIVGLALGSIGLALAVVFMVMRKPAPAPAPVQVAAAPAVVPAAVPVPVPVEVAPNPPEPVPVATPKPKAIPAPVKPVPKPAPVEAPVQAAPPPAAEDNAGPLQALPEAIQREVPKVAFGGYIYSPNPAERLLLVDKMLRREGEEVAPGLVLERLMPKAAVMNYRGYRYRVPY